MKEGDKPTDGRPNPFAGLPRCDARNRRGGRCQRPAGPSGRCYYHGGAPGSGAPSGKRNGNYRHGRRTKEAEAIRRTFRQALQRSRELLRALTGEFG